MLENEYAYEGDDFEEEPEEGEKSPTGEVELTGEALPVAAPPSQAEPSLTHPQAEQHTGSPAAGLRISSAPTSLSDNNRLNTRLAAARATAAACIERRRAAIDAIAAEDTTLEELRRKLSAMYERLSNQLELPQEQSEAMIKSDAELTEAADEVEMLRQRLRTTKMVLRQQTATRDALRMRLGSVEQFGIGASQRPATAGGVSASNSEKARVAAAARLNADQVDQMVKRLAPSAERLASRPGLHPNSQRLFQSQGISVTASEGGATAAATAEGGAVRKKVSDKDFINNLYTVPLRRAAERVEKSTRERAAESLGMASRAPLSKQEVCWQEAQRVQAVARQVSLLALTP